MTSKQQSQPRIAPEHVPNGKLNVRFFKPHGDAGGYVRVAQHGRVWLWERRNHNGSLSSSGVGYPSAIAACEASGCNPDAEFSPDALSDALFDAIEVGAGIVDKPHERARDVADRLRKLDANEQPTELRLLRVMLEAHTEDSLREAAVPHHITKRARMLVDRATMKQYLEELPVIEGRERVAKHCTGFVLVGERWWPANIKWPAAGAVRFVQYNTIDAGGAVDGSGVARWPEWAHCTADGKPSIE